MIVTVGSKTHRKTPRYEKKREKPDRKQKTTFDTGSGTEKQKIKLIKGGERRRTGRRKKGFVIGANLQKRDMPHKTQRGQDAGISSKSRNRAFWTSGGAFRRLLL